MFSKKVMSVSDVQKFSDYKKQHEFFEVKPVVGCVPKVKEDRWKDWVSMCQEAHLGLKDWYLSGNKEVVLTFQNGLEIIDGGRFVSFSTEGNKAEMNMEPALTIVRCSATHLCKNGWDLGVDFSAIRPGAGEMIGVFEKAYDKARRNLNAQKISLLKGLQSGKNVDR